MGTCKDEIDLLDEIGSSAAVEVASLGCGLSLLVIAESCVVSLAESVHF